MHRLRLRSAKRLSLPLKTRVERQKLVRSYRGNWCELQPVIYSTTVWRLLHVYSVPDPCNRCWEQGDEFVEGKLS